jgi:hypothetical protein
MIENCPAIDRAVSKLSLPAPTARNVKAWGNASGKEKLNFEALKARHSLHDRYFAPSALGRIYSPTWAGGPGFHISRLWRWEP